MFATLEQSSDTPLTPPATYSLLLKEQYPAQNLGVGMSSFLVQPPCANKETGYKHPDVRINNTSKVDFRMEDIFPMIIQI